MIDGSAVLGVFSVYIAGVVIPGPNFVAVAHKAASATRIEALTLSHARIASAYRRAKAWIDRVCGGLIVALGVRQLIR